MNAFDTKCGNPVRTNLNPPSKATSYEWETYFLDDDVAIRPSSPEEEELSGEEEVTDNENSAENLMIGPSEALESNASSIENFETHEHRKS